MPHSWKALLQPARFWELFKNTFTAWSDDKVPRHGAALAYYTVLSLVPLLVVIIAMIGVIFGREAAQGYILEQIGSLVGPQSEAAIKEMIQRASEPSTGIFAAAVAGVTLLVGASGVFAQLQDSLNSIWGVKAKEGRGLWGLIRDRFFSVAALLGTGFLLLVSLVLSAALSAFGKWFGGRLRLPSWYSRSWSLLFLSALSPDCSPLSLRFFPMPTWPGETVWVGSAMTALLFTIGKFAIGLYSERATSGPRTALQDPWSFCSCGCITRRRSYYSALNLLRSMPTHLARESSRLTMPTWADPAKAKDSNTAQRLQHRWGAHPSWGRQRY